jgi:hypothetical protein
MQIVISFDFVQARIQLTDIGKYSQYKFSFPFITNRIVPSNIEQAEAQSDRYDDITSDIAQRVLLPWVDKKITVSFKKFPKVTGIRI